MTEEVILPFLSLLLLAWLVGIQLYQLQNSFDTEVRCTEIEQELRSLDDDIERRIVSLAESEQYFLSEATTLLQRLADLSEDVKGEIAKRRKLAKEEDKAKKRKEELPPTDAGPTVDEGANQIDAASAGGSEAPSMETEDKARVGMLKYVTQNAPKLDDPTANEIKVYTREAYATLYRFAEYVAQVTAWRETWSPLIKAIEARYDRMLYNYI
jgi:hypothetical protein